MKKVLFFIIALVIFMPCIAFAVESSEFEVVSKSEKYYKTTYQHTFNSLIKSSNLEPYITEEISKEEYEQGGIVTYGDSRVETTYKKLTSYILKSGSNYRYKAVLNWKNFPSVRSYDIIGIGFYPSVKLKSSLSFSQTYCLTNGSCKTITAHYPQIFSGGAGASFKVPTGNLSQLSQTIYFDVEKNADATVLKQIAAADYSHAIKSVSVAQGKSYTVNSLGISLDANIANYYDQINSATATWQGTW